MTAVTVADQPCLIDTSILIEHLRGNASATHLLLDLPARHRLVSVLTRIEVEGGMRSAERADVAALFDSVRLVPVTDRIAREAGRLLRRYRRSHRGIDLVDYVIAASARLRRARLLTLNVKHFPMMEGLTTPW